MKFVFRALATIVVASILMPAYVAAQGLQPIRIVLPFPPGGGTDIVTRLIAEQMTRQLSQTVLTVNRSGGEGTIAAGEVAQAEPDGLTLLFATGSGLIAQPLLRGSGVPYDPFKDFAPISSLGRFTLVLVVSPGLPVNNVAEFVEHVRASPGKFNYAASSNTTRMAVIQLMNQYNLDMAYVPYKGDGPARQDMMADRVQAMVTPTAGAVPLARDGKLRALVVLSDSRSPAMPTVPNLKEAGVRITVLPWAGLYGPSKLPNATVERINRAVHQSLAVKELRDRLEPLGFEPFPTTPAGMGEIHRREYEVFRKAIQEDGIKFAD